MPVRVECTIDDLAECYLEVADAWSLREIRGYQEATDEDWWSLWRRKVIGCRLVTADGEAINDPATVQARWEELDARLVQFARWGVLDAVDYLLQLGKQRKRLSLPVTGAAARMTPVTTN